MSSARPDAPSSATESVAFPCDFAAGRAASRRLCDFLSRHGLSEAEVFACELALTEACNNAVQHVGDRGRPLPITATAICGPARIELQVLDHTGGFDWPAGPLAPPGPDAEHGRGLFIIQSIMDGASYVRGPGGNALTMWKKRPDATG